MQYREFSALLRQKGVGRLYLLTGEEPYYLEKAKDELLNAFFPDGDAAEALTVLDEGAPLGRLLEAIESIPFFVERNVVLVKGSSLFKEKKQSAAEKEGGKRKKKSGSEQQADRLLELLADMPETSAVIFLAPGKPDKRKKIYKTIEKHGIVLESEAVRPWHLADWLTERLRERQMKLDRKAELYFVEVAGLMNPISLSFLDRELEKLALFSQGRRVTEAEVREAFSTVPEVSGFALLDAIDAQDAKRALSLLERQIAENVYLPQLLGLLATHLRRLLQAQLYMARGVRGKELGKPLELNPYIADRVGQTAIKYPNALLKRVFLELTDADYYLKTGQCGAELLEQAVIALVKRR